MGKCCSKFRGHNTKFFKDELQEKKYQELRQHERTGRFSLMGDSN